MNEIRIRDNLRTAVQYLWPNPKLTPVKDPQAKFLKEQERLNRDARAFKARCEFAGL